MNAIQQWRSVATLIGFSLALAIQAGAEDGGPAQMGKRVIHPAFWKVTFPVAGPKGNALEVKNPQFTSYVVDPKGFPPELKKFVEPSEEGLVVRTEYTGVTTSTGTRYSRTEFREMSGAVERNWTLEEGGELRCRLKVAKLEGGANKLFFMQIHGEAPESKPLLKCIWEKGRIRLLTKSGEKLKDFSRKKYYQKIPENEWFTCAIKADREAITVRINGELVETYPAREVAEFWPKNNTYYFKAGNYLQHDVPGARSTVVFSRVVLSHEKGG